jgi:transketolase
MRKEFSQWLERTALKNQKLIFITGDLGFNALENVKEKIGSRFVNAGVSEQNMVSMAAAFAHQGLAPICYSIAPFCVFRPAEQIRVDVCLHNMNVKIVGNGGGYGYGIMGATHHAIEDLAVLSGFPNMKCFVPFCNQAVQYVSDQMMSYRGPSYLRLGFGVAPNDLNDYQKYLPIQHLKSGDQWTIVGVGPVLLNAVAASKNTNVSADIFVVNELPLENLSNELILSLKKTKRLLVVEEHVARGGLGEHLCLHLQKHQISLEKFVHQSAQGYPSKRYGSQAFHQSENKMDEISLSKIFKELT